MIPASPASELWSCARADVARNASRSVGARKLNIVVKGMSQLGVKKERVFFFCVEGREGGSVLPQTRGGSRMCVRQSSWELEWKKWTHGMAACWVES